MAHGWTMQDVTCHNLKHVSTKPSKYRNTKKLVNGILFDSTKESLRYVDLALLQAAGEIRDLQVQPEFDLIASNGEIVAIYRADFSYWDVRTGQCIVEDVKCEATKTAVYRLKKKLVSACHGITITEI